MSEHKSTTVKTEYKDGKKIVTKTEVITTQLDDSNETPNPSSFLNSSVKEIQPKVSRESFEKEALKVHNQYRRLHKSPPLEWSKECQKHAQTHADHLLKTNTFGHSSSKFGENLFSSWSSRGSVVSAESAVKSWYDEIKDFTFGQPSPSNISQVGHFTQVVWKETTKVGMAFAEKDGRVIVVANYLPRGNVIGYFHTNVLAV